MAPFEEQRRTIRIAVHGNLTVQSMAAGQPLRLVDVGMGGFCVQSDAPVPLDVVASYKFATPNGKWSAIFRARAVYSKVLPPDGTTARHYVSGLSFVNVESEAVQRQLFAMMDYAMAFVSFS